MERIARMFGVRRYNDLGFTLVELLVVIAIIGILAGISIPMFLGQRTKAIRSEATTNLQTLYTLQEQYYAEYGRYAPWPNKADPTSVANYKYLGTYGSGTNGIEDAFPMFKPGEINELNYDYYCKSIAPGQQYFMAAVGKAGSPAAGQIVYLNYLNKWEGL